MRPTVVEVAARGDSVACVLDGELVIPRLVRRHDRSVEVALVAGRAMLMPGDRVQIDIRVGDGCALRLVDIGGLVVYGRDESGESEWHAHIELGAHARLVWEGLPTVITDAGSLIRSTTMRLGPRAAALVRETLVLGRAGEHGGRLTADTDVTDAAGPVLRERLAVRGDEPRPGILGAHCVMDTALYLGDGVAVPDVPAAVRLDLERGGTVLRHLGTTAHDSPLEVLRPLALPHPPTLATTNGESHDTTESRGPTRPPRDRRAGDTRLGSVPRGGSAG